MTPEITVLAIAAASIAFVHTVLGPDHYLPFIATLGVIMVTGVFGVVTVATITIVVLAAMQGLDRLKFQSRFGNLARFGHAAAGGTLLICGMSVTFLGL